MNIFLDFDAQAQSAPQSFRDAVQAAANLFATAFNNSQSVDDNIDLFIAVGYGESQGTPTPSGGATGTPFGSVFGYSQVVGLLGKDLAGEAVQSGLSALPSGSSIQGQSQVEVWNAEQKVLGLMPAFAGGVDGAIGFATNIPTADLTSVAVREIAHAIGLVANGPLPDIFDLFRYTADGSLLIDDGPTPDGPAYFSLDGGTTDLADYGINLDPSEFLGSGSKTPNDLFNEDSSSASFPFLTPVDILQMEALGFHGTPNPVGDFLGLDGLQGESQALFRNGAGDLYVKEENGDQDFGVNIANAWQVEQIGDFNGDGKADILWRNSSNNDVGLWNSVATVGSLNFTQQDVGIVDPSWHVAGSGNFSGVGLDQILWRNDDGDLGLWSEKPGAGNVTFTYQILGNVATDWQIVGVGDFNDDGKTDILWRNSSSGDVGLWNSVAGAGSVSFSYQDLGPVSSDWVVQGVGDFNGDGKADILWRNTNTNDVGVWFGNGSSFTPQDFGAIDPSWHIRDVADFNGDGKDDILWQNDNGQIGWWFGDTVVATGSFFWLQASDQGAYSTDWHIQSNWTGT